MTLGNEGAFTIIINFVDTSSRKYLFYGFRGLKYDPHYGLPLDVFMLLFHLGISALCIGRDIRHHSHHIEARTSYNSVAICSKALSCVPATFMNCSC